MESIERIGPPPQIEMNPMDGYTVTMREFLAKPRVARHFQEVKADAQRLNSMHKECEILRERAAEAELDAGRIARAADEDGRNRLSFGVGVVLASCFVLLDAFPANLAAQTFGLDTLPTWGITAVLVGALAAGMWAVTHYRNGWRRGVTIGVLGAGLVALGVLRYWFVWVTAGDPFSAVLGAISLTVFTTMMVWLGVLVLSFTKSRHVSAADRHARGWRRQAEKKAAHAAELNRRLEAARTEFLGDAQLFSFRSFQNEIRRNQFIDYVGAQLDR